MGRVTSYTEILRGGDESFADADEYTDGET